MRFEGPAVDVNRSGHLGGNRPGRRPAEGPKPPWQSSCWLLWAGCLVFASACGGRATPQGTEGRPSEPSPTAASEEPADSAPPADRQTQLAIDEALGRMAHFRELQPKRGVEARHLSAQELVEQVELSLDQHVPPRAITGTSEMLFGLGTVPHDFDYRARLLELMGTELAGMYDPARQLMLLRADLPEDALEATLLHELVHALQDQHYDLARVLEWREDATDESSALSALAEGDATSAMIDAMIGVTGQRAYQLPSELLETQMRAMTGVSGNASIPSILKRSVIAPYLDGLRFVNEVRAQAGWAGVDRVWARPPASTEQLLHLDKYAAGEAPVEVSVPSPPPGPKNATWQPLLHDVWGEQSVRILYEEWLPTRTAISSAAGWGGDRIVVYGSDTLRAVAWHLVADTPEAAERMHIAFLRGIFAETNPDGPHRLPQSSEEDAKKRVAQDHVCRERQEAGPWLARRQGASVVVIAGIYDRSKNPPVAAANCRAASTWASTILGQGAKSGSPRAAVKGSFPSPLP